MLNGIDISEFNSGVDYNSPDFIMMRATFGSTDKDAYLDQHYTAIHGSTDPTPDKNKLYGFYHYAYPHYNPNPAVEAENFLDAVGHHAGYAMYALDWEQDSLTFSPEWALEWLDYVYRKTGIKPLFYIQASAENSGKYSAIAKEDYGLWLADWSAKPTVTSWPFYTMWQHRGDPLDLDIFNGDADIWRVYCFGEARETEPPANHETFKIGDEVYVKSRFDADGIKREDYYLFAKFYVMKVNGDEIVITRKGGLPTTFASKDLGKC